MIHPCTIDFIKYANTNLYMKIAILKKNYHLYKN